jgi:hypothetical protein
VSCCTSCSASRSDGARREEGNLSVCTRHVDSCSNWGVCNRQPGTGGGWELGCTMHATCEVRELGMPCRRLLELRLPACLCREGNETKRKRRERRQAEDGRGEGGKFSRLRHRRCSCCNAITAYSLLPSLGAAFTNFHHSPAFPCLYKAPEL